MNAPLSQLPTPESAARMAQECLTRFLKDDFKKGRDVHDTLRAYPWANHLTRQPSQGELMSMNQALDPHSCLGRLALCFALIERFHPDQISNYRFFEIVDDWFLSQMMMQWQSGYESGVHELPDDWLEEFLMYEEPHGAVKGAGSYQFDPLSVMITDGRKVMHRAGKEHSPWHAVAASMMVSIARATADPKDMLAILLHAESVCPGMNVVGQNMVYPLIALGEIGAARTRLEQVVREKPTSLGFHLLDSVFEFGTRWPERLYGHRLWGLLSAHHERAEAIVLREGIREGVLS